MAIRVRGWGGAVSDMEFVHCHFRPAVEVFCEGAHRFFAVQAPCEATKGRGCGCATSAFDGFMKRSLQRSGGTGGPRDMWRARSFSEKHRTTKKSILDLTK